MKVHEIDQAVEALVEEIHIDKEKYNPCVEHAFMYHYAKKLGATSIRIGRHEIAQGNIDDEDRTIISVTIFFDGVSTTNTEVPDSLYLAYWDIKNGIALLIIDPDDNILYRRNADQNPKTGWVINELADDATDENGKIIFPGDPYGI